MSLPPDTSAIDQVAERLEREAIDSGHDIGEGFEPAEVLGTPGFLRMECRTCRAVAYVSPWGGVDPMNPGRCRGKAISSELSGSRL